MRGGGLSMGLNWGIGVSFRNIVGILLEGADFSDGGGAYGG